MNHYKRNIKFYYLSFLKHDFKSSIAVFFVALPLCLGIALASNVPIYSGLIAGIVGGLVVTIISGSPLSVSGPAAGLTAICATAISELGTIEIFFLSVMIGGLLQSFLGILKLGGFTYFIPSAVIKGMLTAIGIMLISKQIPFLIGYDKPDFWTNQLFNIFTLNNTFQHIDTIYLHSSKGVIIIVLCSIIVLYVWKKIFRDKNLFFPPSVFLVFFGILINLIFIKFFPSLALNSAQLIQIPDNIFSTIKLPDFSHLFSNSLIWKNAVIICFVASIETLLSLAAIDKLDPYNRITPQNRELIAQGTGNFFSGFLGGLPITSVIVRSSANVEAKAKTKQSAFLHGLWLLLAILFAIPVLNLIPFCVLAVILIRTGYNLAKPKMIISVYKQGREQFMPFIVTIIAILISDLLIGVLIGIIYAIYFIIKHTYQAGYIIIEKHEGHIKEYFIELAQNVSYLNKKKFIELLDSIPEYSYIEIDGSKSHYIDRDILEVFNEYKIKAKQKHIELKLFGIQEVDIISNKGH